MSIGTEMFNDVNAASLVAGVLTSVLTLFSLDAPHWERKFAANAREYEIRTELTKRYYHNRPFGLYDLVSHLALRAPIRGRRDRFRLRAERAANLAEPLRSNATAAAKEWITTVGAFAEEAAHERIDLRPFLGTYHLGVIREGVIAVPVAMSMIAQRQLSAEEIDRLSWGLALVELAVAYNSRARQQRGAIYFTARGHKPPIGPVLRAPGRWKRGAYDVVELFERPLRLPRWGRWRWERWLSGIDVEVPDS